MVGAEVLLLRCLAMLYAQGILAGAWVVSAAWVDACLAARPSASNTLQASLQLLPEGDYEVLGDGSGAAGGPARGRHCKLQQQAPLLAGYRVLVAGELQAVAAHGQQVLAYACLQLDARHMLRCAFTGSGAAKESCASLVQAAGGTLVARLPSAGDAAAEGSSFVVLVPDGAAVSGQSKAAAAGGASSAQLQAARHQGLSIVRQRWLMDGVSAMQLPAVDGYLV